MDQKEVAEIFEKLKATFKTGKTKPIEWRKKMIKEFMKGCNEMKDELGEAI